MADSEDASPVPDVSIGAELHVFTDGNGALDGVPISPPDATDGQDAVDESEVSDTADRFDVGSISDSSDAPAVTQVPDGSPIIDTSGDDALPVVDASDALVVVDAPDGDPIDVVHVDLGSDSDHAVD